MCDGKPNTKQELYFKIVHGLRLTFIDLPVVEVLKLDPPRSIRVSVVGENNVKRYRIDIVEER